MIATALVSHLKENKLHGYHLDCDQLGAKVAKHFYSDSEEVEENVPLNCLLNSPLSTNIIDYYICRYII